jgi:hypothetical protein
MKSARRILGNAMLEKSKTKFLSLPFVTPGFEPTGMHTVATSGLPLVTLSQLEVLDSKQT